MKNKKSIFIQGPIEAGFIGESIAKHQSKTTIGAHEIFLGQVRADVIDMKVVRSIEYTAYEEMAEEKAYEIRESAFEKYELSCMHIYHSLGEVQAGELCFCVFASSAHRRDAREAVAYLVDRLKKELPVFGKEIFHDASHRWKTNN
jgi:molybdopterin synthase catalytic subunit